MRLAFLYGAKILAGRRFDFADLYGSPKGLTGSEVSFFEYARGMRRLGHDVILRLPTGRETFEWEGCRVMDSRHPLPEVDVAYAWHEPDLLRGVNALRMVNEQLNDFSYAAAGYDEHVDIYTSPSRNHLEHMVAMTGTPIAKWRVQPNGCDPALYAGHEKVPGRVVYCSSPDRGLHLLLSAWPKIHRAVPAAHLRVFYNIDGWLRAMGSRPVGASPELLEMYNRAIYIRGAMWRLGESVEVIGSVSRDRIAREMAEAEVMAYPCDPVLYTEGFSVATLEACAAGTVPVITDADALGSIYGGVAPMVTRPVAAHLGEWSDMVIEALRSPIYRGDVANKGRTLAAKYTWPELCQQLDGLIVEAVAGRHQGAA